MMGAGLCREMWWMGLQPAFKADDTTSVNVELLPGVASYRGSASLSDAELVLGGRRIPAHRCKHLATARPLSVHLQGVGYRDSACQPVPGLH